MISPKQASETTQSQSEFLQLFERLTNSMLQGDLATCQRIVEENPQYAEQLNSILPAIQMMHDAKSGDTTGIAAGASIPADDPHLSLQGRLGDFQLIREIGRGGMGVVYEAEQNLLGRRVALKVLPFAAMVDERHRLRFQNEARAAATLDHPHIVPIYFVGVERGIHFYAMQFVQGQSLAELLQDLRLTQVSDEPTKMESGELNAPVSSAATTVEHVQAELSTLRTDRKPKYFEVIAELGADIADALQHAHERGIVHRDIKPSNLLLNHEGKCLISDFGLARLDDDANLTLTGDVLGTLRYVPPEQVLGKKSEIDHRADIYSLGVTLYELLSLQPANGGQNGEQLLKQAAESSPARLRSHDASIPADLETIVHKAMERDPDDRFSSAAEMAEELRRFVACRPLSIRRPNIVQRSMKWVRRHPKMTLATVAVLLGFLTVTTVGLLVLNRERMNTAAERDVARENLQLAIAALDEVHQEISSNWIDSDRNLSNTQAALLRRSAVLLTGIADRFPDDSTYYAQSGLAHLHAANANARTAHFEEAAVGYEKACAALGKAVHEHPSDVHPRWALATAKLKQARLHIDRWQFDLAEASLDEAASHLQHLMTVQPQNEDLLIQHLETQIELLLLASLELRDEEVIKKGNRLLAQLQDLWDINRDRIELQLVRLRMAALVSKSLRRAGNLQDALTLCEELLDDAEFAMQDSHDNRAAERALASLAAELGRCHRDLGAYEKAEQYLRDAMARLRRSFIFHGTPKEFSHAYMRQQAVHDQMEPGAFAQYARTQASLAEVLQNTEDSQTAFVQADEAVRTCYTLVLLFPEFPAYLADTVACALVLARIDDLPDGSSTLRQGLLGDVVAATAKGNWAHVGAAEFLQDLNDLQRSGTP